MNNSDSARRWRAVKALPWRSFERLCRQLRWCHRLHRWFGRRSDAGYRRLLALWSERLAPVLQPHDGLWIADQQGQLLSCNEALPTLFQALASHAPQGANGGQPLCGRSLDELGWSPGEWPPAGAERRWRRLAVESDTPLWVQETVIPLKGGHYFGWWQLLQEPMSRSGLTVFSAQGTQVILDIGPRLLQARSVDEVLTQMGEMAQAMCEAPSVEIFMRQGGDGFRSVWRRGKSQSGVSLPAESVNQLAANLKEPRVWTRADLPPEVRQTSDLASLAMWPVRLSPQWEILIACYNLPERVPACWDALPHAWFVHLSALALLRAWEAERAQRRLAMIQTWRVIETSISSRLSCHEIAEIFVQEVMTRLSFDAVAVTFWDEAPTPCQSMHREAGFPRPDCLANRSREFWEEHPIGRQVRQERRIYLDPGWESRPRPVPPECGGEEFKAYVAVPLLAQDRFWGVLELFSRQPFLDPDEIETLAQALGAQFAIALDNAHLLNELRKALKEVSDAYDRTIEGWVQMLDMRDEETEGHTQRVARMAVALAEAMNFSEEELQHVRRGALLHDIGKISIPDRVLRKPGPLTAEEWEIMRQHPQRAYEILSSIEYLRPALDIPYAHHERWDGSGYPRGLKGEEIPLPARLFAVVDVYDALTSNRPYRKAWPKEKALKFIASKAGKWFDPEVVRVFLKLVQEEKHPAFQPELNGALGSEAHDDTVTSKNPEVRQPAE
ncbi:MAG: HD domain-containing protein [Chloroflexi bacterium]|nr:HD domain-containing protein [Chloroflexota bacterium]